MLKRKIEDDSQSVESNDSNDSSDSFEPLNFVIKVQLSHLSGSILSFSEKGKI